MKVGFLRSQNMGMAMLAAACKPSEGSTCRPNDSGLGLLVLCAVIMGCGEGGPGGFERGAATESSPGDVTRATPATSPSNVEAAKEAVPTVQPRKIIYNARVELVVEDLTSVVDGLAGLIKTHGGYVAETDVSGSVGGRRMGTWKVRVPVERFDAFLEAVARLGELQRNHVDSQDVTQEFYDIEARIANNQQEEKRLLKHLGESTGNLEDILAVEREISRVRGEIEQMQGRLRYLANVTALSTVTVSASELRDFTTPISPAFSTQIGRTFLESVKLLVDFGKGVVLVAVAASPWLPVAVLIAWPLWRLVRHMPRPSRMS